MAKESTEEKIQQLQLAEQNLQGFLMQKQQFKTQLIELESALNEIKGKKTAYKIVSNIMVETKAEDLKKELEEKKKLVELRIKSLEKQETALQEKTKKLQTEVVGEMKKSE